MKNKLLAVFHFLLVILLIAWNYLTNTGKFHEQTVGEISSKFYNLFTPASYAFSIWGIIFLALLAMSVYLLKKAFTSGLDPAVSRALPLILLAYLGIMAWLWFWLQQETLLSVGIMLLILVSFLSARLILEKGEESMSKTARWLQVKPVELIAAWITVALTANITAHLVAVDWDGWGLKADSWAILLIAIVMLINYFVLKTRGYVLFPLVAIWALVAISVKHYESNNALFGIPLLAVFGLLVIIIQHLRQRENQPSLR